MKLIEYQGKDLFRRVGIPTPNGVFATSAADVKTFIEKNPGSWVLKSQVMMGGRGKAGGIKFADDAATGETLAKINEFGNRTEVEQPLHDVSQRRIGVIAMVFAYKVGDDKSQFLMKAAMIRDELERKIPDAASLMKPNASGP